MLGIVALIAATVALFAVSIALQSSPDFWEPLVFTRQHPTSLAFPASGPVIIEGALCNLTDEPITALVDLNWTRVDPKGYGEPIFVAQPQTYAPGCEVHTIGVCPPIIEIRDQKIPAHCTGPFINAVPPSVKAQAEATPAATWSITGSAVPQDHKTPKAAKIESDPFGLVPT